MTREDNPQSIPYVVSILGGPPFRRGTIVTIVTFQPARFREAKIQNQHIQNDTHAYRRVTFPIITFSS